jgi:hypothetical protein
VLLERGLQVRDFDVAATKPFASLDFGDREVADKGDLISRFRKNFLLGLLVAPGLSVFGLNSIIVDPLGLYVPKVQINIAKLKFASVPLLP